MKQMTLTTFKGFETHGRAMCKAAFLARMEMLVPWAAFYSANRTTLPEGGFRKSASNVLDRQLVQLG